ncbi:hypothetical protein Daus18300_010317 [Diaporthe australafricana]|uniref:Uncharacterized protein n=1 Tax=Diaporthe australafricana TaxID=127596 RepID=A0ABR3WBF7_9PEZI
MAGPYKPDDEERDEYYYGIAGKPRLVARTSSSRWSKPENTGAFFGQCRKRYAAILEREQPEIVSKWTRTLTLALVNGLRDCSWSYFFPIRIGLRETSLSELPTILLVAVEEGSLQWEEGVTVALECRKILRDFEIANVEVEIREGTYAPCAATAEFERQIDPEAWTSIRCPTNHYALPMLSSLGYIIGYAEDRKAEGSVGLHLRLGDDNPAVYALTCRHVVSNGREPSESYTVSEGHKQHHVRAGDKGYADCLKKLESYQDELDDESEPLQTKKQRWEEWYQHEEGHEHKRPTKRDTYALNHLQFRASYNKRVVDLFGSISHKKDRHIGHLALHPKLELCPEQPDYLKDWALIELDLDNFNKAPDNTVFVGAVDSHTHRGVPEYNLDKGFLPLHLDGQDLGNSSDPADKVFNGTCETNNGHSKIKADLNRGFLSLYLDSKGLGGRRRFDVAKRGFKTGLTFGTMSSIEAVVRRQASLKHQFAWEMLIVPKDDHRVFSAAGDSGFVVFDMNGAVIGLLNGRTDELSHIWRGIPGTPPKLKEYPGGTAGPEEADETMSDDLATWSVGTDVTFATPIQWVLDDIARFTGLEPRLA